MDFFPPDPPQPEYDEPERDPRWSAPDDEVPVQLGEAQVLARTEHVAIVFRGADVFRDGVELRVQRVLRRGDLKLEEWTTQSSRFMEHGPGVAADRLRLGLVLPDGVQLFADRQWGGGGELDASGPSLARTGGSGGGGSRAYTTHDGLWLRPLPPSGALELVLQWPAFGIPETHATIELGDTHAAAAGVIPLWGDEAASRNHV